MKKLLFFFLAGILLSFASCKKNPPPCPKPPTETGLALNFPTTSGTQNTYLFNIYYEEPNPTPGSYFDVMVTPEGQASKTYKAYTDGLSHQLSDGSLGIASVEFSIPLNAKTFTVIRTGMLPTRLHAYCESGTPSQPMTYSNVQK